MTTGNDAAKRMISAALGGRQSRRLQMRHRPIPASAAEEQEAGEGEQARIGAEEATVQASSFSRSSPLPPLRALFTPDPPSSNEVEAQSTVRPAVEEQPAVIVPTTPIADAEQGASMSVDEKVGEKKTPVKGSLRNRSTLERKYKPNGSVVVGMVEHRGSSRCERCQLDDLPCFQREGKATMKCKSCTSDHCSFHSGHAGSSSTRASGSAHAPKVSSKALVHLGELAALASTETNRMRRKTLKRAVEGLRVVLGVEQSDSEDDIEQLEESDDEDQGSGKKRKRGLSKR
ncbi:hypothetical protein BD324DRAFT_680634 [Kockovaella imperatae]|uniref:Uncharacterized protein n=1 Tax=Kockovaella imperatae TaxID=4999 RepID=A0A1Y1UI71_9TREE|nr:hypothetical protein BD324DRAFT_680634 [Kockovaella imperatae]ORX37748.1 hypothetical protein BD324DRAFT_680634 [Kockovaella imperatae]